MITKAATRSKIFLVVGLMVTLLLPGFVLGQRAGGPRSLEGQMQAESLAFLDSLKIEQMEPADAPAFRLPTRMPGFTCLPTCDPTDGRFLAVASDFVTLSDPDLELQLAVPAGTTTFSIGIFDGDAGEIQASTGESRWDSGAVPTPFEYTLLADPLGDGSGATIIELLPGQPSIASSLLPNDDWANFAINTTAVAQSPSGNFFYRLRIVNLMPSVPVVNAFKIRTDGQTLISPTAQPFSYIANFGPSLTDVQTVYPGFPAATPTTYDGSFIFYFEMPAALPELELFDGDFDRGDFDGINNQDTDDPNTPNAPFVPPFATIDTMAEGVAIGFGGATGDPPDDNDGAGNGIFLVRPPSVRYDLMFPNGPIFANENPSGNQEWERFVVSTVSAAEDHMTGSIPAGTYAIAINGVDLQNLNALRIFNRVICVDEMGDPCGPILRLFLVGDTVFADIDGSGTQDPGEPGIEGVQVNLLGALGSALATTTTDINGNYSFEVDAGTFEVEVDPSNFDLGEPLDGLVSTTGDAITDTVVNANVLTYDFGYAGTASIGDYVWYDDSADGLQNENPDAGLEGVEVNLTEAGPDAMFGTLDDVFFASETTDDDGFYEFSGLLAGLYRVEVDASTLPDGLILTTANQPLDVTLASGDAFVDADFGYVAEFLGSIGDLVWEDRDASGIQESGEAGLNGVTVTLEGDIDGDGIAEVVRTTVTATVMGVDGFFLFANLPAANCEADGGGGGPVGAPDTIPAGLIQLREPTVDCAYVVTVDDGTLPPGIDDPTFDFDDISTPNVATLTLAEEEENDLVDFGYRGDGQLGDRVWDDFNGDGVQDSGEPGLNGVTVTLRDSGGNVIGTTTTAGDGMYLFEFLGADTFKVDVDPSTLPAGYSQTFDLDGAATANTADAALAASEVRDDVDFGYVRLGSLGDRVWFDTNGNGVQDLVEPGLNGVTVNLRDSGGALITSTVTAGDGGYSFGDLLTGTYMVEVDASTLPADHTQTFDLDGLGSANIATVTLAVSQDRDDVDFGYVQLGSIGDRVWDDVDNDGVQDAGEVGLNGVTVNVLDGGGVVIATATTSGDGGYTFGGLLGGAYTAQVDASTLPAGYEPTFDLDGLTTINSASLVLGTGEDRTDVDFGYAVCGPCSGKVSRLTFQYNGSASAEIRVEGKRGPDDDDLFVGTVQPGGTFEITGPGSGTPGFSGTVGTEIRIFVDGVLHTSIHTSCSEPIFPGLISGDFEVLAGASKQGGPLCPEDQGPVDPTEICAEGAVADEFGSSNGHAISLPGIGTDFVFEPDQGSWMFDDGMRTARLSGTVRSASNPSAGFVVDVLFNGLTSVAPAGSPKLELDSAAYVANGGPVDPSTWVFYTDFVGTLTGTGDLAGAIVHIERRGVAFQVGEGANGKNARFGGSGWLDYIVSSQPTGASLPSSGDGDINIDIVDCESAECLTIDFAQFSAGQVIDDELAAMGIHVTTDNASTPAMIFDSSDPTGGDFDLGTPNQTFGGPGIGAGGEAGQAGENAIGLGNLLILSEDGNDGSDPDDNASGGEFIFTFDDPVLIESVSLVDIDEQTNCTLEAFDADGGLIGGAAAQTLGNNSVQKLVLGTNGVSTLKVKLTGSGAISSLVVCPGDGGSEPPSGDCEPGDVKDSFDSNDFSGNIGGNDWTGPWIENDVAGSGPATGNVWVDNGFMFLKDAPDTGTEPSAAREVDLSGALVATLEFKFDTFAGVDSDDAVTVEVSDNGGATWTVLEVITGISGSVTEIHTLDISGHISANTQVRFRVSNNYGGSNEAFCLRWVKVLWSCDDTGSGGGGGDGHTGDHYAGYLGSTGEYHWQPDGNYYYSVAGSHQGVLEGPGSADLDLYLHRWNGSSWQVVASGTSYSSNETVTYNGAEGYYAWLVKSYDGSGNYDVWLVIP